MAAQHVLNRGDVDGWVLFRALLTPGTWRQHNNKTHSKTLQSPETYPFLHTSAWICTYMYTAVHTYIHACSACIRINIYACEPIGSEISDALFSRTRQNSRVLWLSSVDSRSTETFGSVCFSRRYIGPVGGVARVKATLLTCRTLVLVCPIINRSNMLL